MPEAIKAHLGSRLPTGTDEAPPSRRQILRGLAAAGVVASGGVLAACGGDDSAGHAAATNGSRNATTPPASPSSSETSPSTGGEPLAKAADIPVGGGRIFNAEKVVVTQPRTGDFKCFSAICTHQACLVSSVDEGLIRCACHGSRYSITDGSVEGGPAPTPLPERMITVTRGEILLA